MNSSEILKKYFGYESFREGQQQLVDSILAGRDTLGVMPTGAGKSICYQVPALMLPGITLIISPLISLMQDQVTALVQAGVKAAYINSSLNQGQMYTVIKNAEKGVYKLIYIAPERLDSEHFIDFARNANISMITVDEAHCISQWGQDFRPSYLNIPKFAAALPVRPVMTAFTATATKRVREDICEILGLCDPFTLVTGFDRKNLYFEVRRPSDKTADLKSLVKKFDHEGRSGIIYCSTRKNVEKLHELLGGSGYSVSRYHAGLSESERAKNQEDFIYDRVKVMIATNAFGMGIDKSNVTFVIHYNMPKDVESYYQEAGRAGRDGSASDCILLYSGNDVVTAKFLINKSFEESELPAEEAENVKLRDMKRLSDMIFYCTGADCLRRYILKYFGENAPDECGNCSYCCSGAGREDITIEAQKIMSCIARAGQRFGLSTVCDILRGKRSEKLTERGLDKLSTYGIMADCQEARLKLICDKLTVMGYIEKTEGQYPILRLTKRSSPVLKGLEKITARLPQTVDKKERTTVVYSVNSELFERLRALRRKIAKVQSMPDYVIFTDMALQDMCRRLPCTEDEFLKVSGVGEAKLERYGSEFIEVITEYVKESSPQPMIVTEASLSRRSLKKEEDIKRGWEDICENSGKIRINDTDITITAFTDQIISDTGAEVSSVPIRKAVTDWLIDEGLLTETKDEQNHSYKTVTENSAEVGIYQEWVTSAAGRRYIRVRYKPEAQQFIADNIENIKEFALERPKK